MDFKIQLENLRQELERRIEDAERVTDFGSDVDPDEETQESEAFANQTALAQVYKNRLIEIERALKKLETKEYGFCEKCGTAISDDILTLVPESRLCQICKKQTND